MFARFRFHAVASATPSLPYHQPHAIKTREICLQMQRLELAALRRLTSAPPCRSIARRFAAARVFSSGARQFRSPAQLSSLRQLRFQIPFHVGT